MSAGFHQSPRQRQELKHHLQFQAKQRTELAELQLRDELAYGESDDDVEPEPLEPQEAEDLGDSDRILEEWPPEPQRFGGWGLGAYDALDVADPFEPEPTTSPPPIGALPLEARPLVRYWIDADYRIHRLDRTDNQFSEWRDLIVQAVVAHLKRHACVLRQPGDWRHIPAIGTDERLIEYLSDRETASGEAEDATQKDQIRALKAQLKRVGKTLKAFAIELPNGDVVTVQALIAPARRDKKATRAGALRCLADASPEQLPPAVAGEPWTAEDWRGVCKADRKAAR